MEQIISGISAKINNKLNEQVTKKQFLKECGFFLFGVMIFPELLTKILNKPRLKMEGNNIYLDDELLIRREND